jgi:hypothetical protein
VAGGVTRTGGKGGGGERIPTGMGTGTSA